jgi:hypothetical protein
MDKTKDDFTCMQMHVYLQHHMTCGYATPDRLWALLWVLLPPLHVPPLQVATPSLQSQLKTPVVCTRHQCLTLTLALVPQEACP